MNTLDRISQLLSEQLDLDSTERYLEVSRNYKFADLSSDIFIDREISNQKKEELLKKINNLKEIKKAEIIKPGFLNIFLSEIGKEQIIDDILDKGDQDYAKTENADRKIQIEYVSANPTGPLTLGNGRGAFCGETLANIYELLGYNLVREYYINNIGRQAEILADSVINEIEGSPRKYEQDDLYQGGYIKNLAEGFTYGDKEPLSKIGARLADLVVIRYIKPTLDSLGIRFDNWQKEDSLYKKEIVEKAVAKLEKKDHLIKKDGALWFKSKKYGDQKNRVVKRKNGEYTYFASDIGYAYDKFNNRKFDKVINFWGADHHGYVDRYRGMLKSFGWGDRWDVVIFQLVNLIEGKNKKTKMSKRKGKYVLLSELVDLVGSDVAKFVFLSRDYNSSLDINLEKLQSKSKDSPIYYIQYAFARINSIESKKDEISPKMNSQTEYKYSQVEAELLLDLLKFEGVLKTIIASNQVHLLANYSNDLAKKFHSFYSDSPILKAPKKARTKRMKLALTTKKVLKNCLRLMGVEQPEKM